MYSPITRSMNNFALDDNASPVIPADSFMGHSKTGQLNISTDGSSFSAPHSRSPSLHAPPSPLGYSLAGLPQDSQDSPYHEYNHNGSVSPALSHVSSFEELEEPIGHYPNDISSSWGPSGLGSPGLGIQIPGGHHSRHVSLEVPSVGPLRSHGRTSSQGSPSDSEGFHSRSRSGSLSRNSPYSRPDFSPGTSPISPYPESSDLLAVPEHQVNLSRRHSASGAQPTLHSPVGVSRHRTVGHRPTHSLGSSSQTVSPFHSPNMSYAGLHSAGHSPIDHSSPLPTVDPSQITSSLEVRKSFVGSPAIQSAATQRRTEGRVVKYHCDVPNCGASFTAKHNLTSRSFSLRYR